MEKMYIAKGKHGNNNVGVRSPDGIQWTKYVSVDEVAGLISQSSNAGTVNDPKTLNLNGFLTLEMFGQILSIIEQSGKYVNLGLTNCTTESSTWFAVTTLPSTGKNKITGISFPNNIKTLPEATSFTNLRTVTLNNIVTLGISCFRSLSNISAMDLSKVTSIGEYCFYNFKALTSVNLSSLNSCGAGAFARSSIVNFITGNNTRFSTIENGKALVQNGNYLISYPSASGTLTIPGVTRVGPAAFGGWISNLTLPDVTRLDYSAFYIISYLSSLIAINVTQIDNGAFSSCFHNQEGATITLKLGKTAPILGHGLFDNDNSTNPVGTVKVLIPTGATGYGSAPTNTTQNCWANGLRGGGWNGSSMTNTTRLKSTITVQFQNY